MKLLTMQFSPSSCHILPLGYKCPPQHPLPIHHQSLFVTHETTYATKIEIEYLLLMYFLLEKSASE
jgi:hypothetical protein